MDKLSANADDNATKKQRRQTMNPRRSTNILSAELQDCLWNLSHTLTDHLPGKLTLCVGMPVMIKINEATECCVTNGAEGVVVGWKSRPISEDKEALETLFVMLTAAPTTVKLDGLPENVVPISHQSRKIRCKMPNGNFLSISRDQVSVIPNFAMTDFGSQGRTRPHNVCDLQNCRSHQSIYTCLSRGSTYNGTIIVQPFDPRKLTGGISGSLRQEFRELELLDEITKLRYLGKISPKVTGITRNELIHSFRKRKGEQFMPKTMHRALKWNVGDTFPIEDVQADAPWQIVEKAKPKDRKQPKPDLPDQPKKTAGYVAAQGTQALTVVSNTVDKKSVKRKREDDCDAVGAKKPRGEQVHAAVNFIGFKWDNANYSCAYDSLLTILLSVYTECTQQWQEMVPEQNALLSKLTGHFNGNSDDIISYTTTIRQSVRDILHAQDPVTYPNGPVGTDIYALVRELLKASEDTQSQYYSCQSCHYSSESEGACNILWDTSKQIWKNSLYKGGSYKGQSVTAWMGAIFNQKTSQMCPQCERTLHQCIRYDEPPAFIALNIHNIKADICTEVTLPDHPERYRLCGLIYFGKFHFTCRVVDRHGDVWFHDGMKTGSNLVPEGNVLSLNSSLLQKAGKRCVSVLVYTRM